MSTTEQDAYNEERIQTLEKKLAKADQALHTIKNVAYSHLKTEPGRSIYSTARKTLEEIRS